MAPDGGTLAPEGRFLADTVNVGPGQRYDVVWTARRPGKWLIHCHIPHHTANDNVEERGGLMMVLDVAGWPGLDLPPWEARRVRRSKGAAMMEQIFKVSGMSCGHCVRSVTEAVHSVDGTAAVQVNLAEKTVAVRSSSDAAKLSAAIADAGYEVLSTAA